MRDIGKLLHQRRDIRRLNREEKYQILITDPNPDPSVYPRTRAYDSGAFRQFHPSWQKQYPWVHYSSFSDGVFCRACALFAPDKVGGNVLGQFVSKPFKSWSSKTQKMTAHSGHDYHLQACSRMQEFLATYENPSGAINVLMDIQVQKQLEENQSVIESLFRCVMFLGKQGLPFRGHRDDNVEWNAECEDINEEGNLGNFIELVRFRAETDPALQKHLSNAPKNAQYTSKTIQNQLIDIVGSHIQSEILDEIQEAKYYSIIADEVVDVSNKEQLSISCRYVLSGGVKEVFVDFVEVERITGKELAEAITDSIHSWGLSLQHMRGQCYDGASNMAGARSGCSAIIREKVPLAQYHHCAAHRLNLAIVSACKIAAFTNTESYIGEMARFFKTSPKRQQLLDAAIQRECPAASVKKLKDSCRTRWVEHIDSYAVFLELLPAVLITLQAMVCPVNFEDLGIDWNWDGETVVKANGFLHQLESSNFLVCFQILLESLTHLRGLSLKLQMQAIDVLYAYNQVKSVHDSFKKIREHSTLNFKRVFKDATLLAKNLHGEDFELVRPRVTARQVHRPNVHTSSVEEFYRITLYNEYLSHLITELDDRFLSNPTHSVGLLQLLPAQCIKSEADGVPKELNEAANFYASDLPHPVMVSREYRKWVAKWKDSSNVPVKLVDVFNECDNTSYPNIYLLLQLALTLPITSCECERSFSQLKLIKTSRRSTTTAARLSSLSLMKINRQRCVKLYNSNLKPLVLAFSQKYNRRIKLPFMLAD